MYSPWMVESMEIIVGSILAAVAYGTVVMTFAGAVAYLLTREHAPAASSASNVVRGPVVANDHHYAGAPSALAG